MPTIPSMFAVDKTLINPFEGAPEDPKNVSSRFYNKQYTKIVDNAHPFTSELKQFLDVSGSLLDLIHPDEFEEFNEYMKTVAGKLDSMDKTSDEYAIYKQGLLYTILALRHKINEKREKSSRSEVATRKYEAVKGHISEFEALAAELISKLGDAPAPPTTRN